MTRKTMNDLKPGMCRWPIGDPHDEDFHFCAEPCDMGLNYCDEHMDIAHNKKSGERGRPRTA